VKKRYHLTSALSINPPFLRNNFSEQGLVTDYRDWQIPLGRRFRSLKIWFVLRTYGISGLQTHIRNHVRLGEIFHGLLLTRRDLFCIVSGPSFALTVFSVNSRWHQYESPSHKASLDIVILNSASNQSDVYHDRYTNDFIPDAVGQAVTQANLLTEAVYELVNSHGIIHVTSTVVNGRYAIRVVSGSPASDEKYVRRAFEIFAEATEAVLKGKRGILARDQHGRGPFEQEK
jgi:aromatic-L-amino-acid/L-tryptophan decarboxylase